MCPTIMNCVSACTNKPDSEKVYMLSNEHNQRRELVGVTFLQGSTQKIELVLPARVLWGEFEVSREHNGQNQQSIKTGLETHGHATVQLLTYHTGADTALVWRTLPQPFAPGGTLLSSPKTVAQKKGEFCTRKIIFVV